ncbi:pericentriolar material 1 protein isoform X2 [Anthonomus grandis grandis]|uniref:pericentriolar material 1 protein isoform X2 n=1 Tax=Anthonomus grandis grandis TaxID=2921223 RepID=UPI0021651545|nr:pericentriolar material 1 protein isoform X2 [Anthonomus grandis grandis]
MADGQGNINRSKNTGTVPKIKYSNNTMAATSSKDQSKSGRLPNKLSPSWHMHIDSANFIQNKRRNKYPGMEVATEGSDTVNGVSYSANGSVNGITPASSSSASRRNSIGSTLKCDNMTKYPDRRVIEDKLSQIREYLEVTSSLMTSIRNSDEQSLSNVDNYSEQSDYIKRAEADFNSFDNELTALRDQQLSILKLQQKSENKLMDARQIQERLERAPICNPVNVEKNINNTSLAEYDTAIKELEERAKRLNRNKSGNEKYSTDKLMSEMQHLQSQIVSMHDANNEREQLIQVLDNRDIELRSQQADLKKKLLELKTKKDQVDKLVIQLQIMDEENHPDVGSQVRNIVAMKDHLSKLKNMLEVVNNTTEGATVQEVQAATNEICLTAENLQNEISKPSHRRNDSYVENRLDNHVLNETYQKQVNKSQRNQGARPKQRTSSNINEKLALQAELEVKKRELEEIMGKHKAATSNLNHDVRGSSGNEISWKPPIFSQDQGSDERLSSDENEENEYSEVNDTDDMVFTPQVNTYYEPNRPNRERENRSECELPREAVQSCSQILSERNLAGLVGNLGERPANNQNQSKQDKVQKQLELIKTVCDSLLENIPANNSTQPPTIQQVRNNITPCSAYSEQPQRVSCPPSPFRPNQNQINVFQPVSDAPWYPLGPGNQNDVHNYQNWLSTNALQTQSFMLNTLNQCCQMLWLQQRELGQLRSTVNMMQDRLEHQPYHHHQQQPLPQPHQETLPSNLHPPPTYPQPPPPPNNHLRVPPPPIPPSSAPKTNHQVSAACSLPNLNQYNPVSAGTDLAFANTSAVPNSALLQSCLNNVSHLNTTQAVEQANNLMHAVNSNLNHHQAIPAQIWNGQALNNQVAPGNRANNYWDNFRSYSRQNQLSSKNSESSIHNAASGIDRLHLDRVNPIPLTTTSKTNSEHSSTNSRENTPRKRSLRVPRHNVENINTVTDHHAPPPPDVLNVNQIVPKSSFNRSAESPGVTQTEPRFGAERVEELELSLHRLLTMETNLHDDINISIEPRPERRRNEWHSGEQQRAQKPKKNKLGDELRENVYKEVASLISANEARPHFLIQLFKDLQKIESDNLRLKILQSVQNILTQSLNGQSNPESSQQITESDSTLSESSEQASVWSRPTKHFTSDILNMRSEGDEPFLQNSYKEIVSVLEANSEDIVGNHLLANIKQVFLESELFQESVKDTVFLKHFSNVLDDVLEQYRGKKVLEVKMNLIQAIGDLLQGELSFIHLIQETVPESYLPDSRKNSIHSNAGYGIPSAIYDISTQGSLQNSNNIENDADDLTEADQSRLGDNAMEDEGAVGGILESPEEESQMSSAQGQSDEILCVTSMDYTENAEGLDQVPTRLATIIKSEATTPTKDILNPCHDPTEPY